MRRETIIPLNEQDWLRMRCFDLTSTDIAALFGCSPYSTAFETWHKKKSGEIPEFSENKRMFWGSKLQDAIAAGIAEQEGWTVRRMNEYMRLSEQRIGASFDFSIEGNRIPAYAEMINENENPSPVPFPQYEENGLLEIKNVDSLQYKQGWLIDDDGNIEAPAHIELQVQAQLLVSGRQYAYIGALVGGNDLKLMKRERNEKIMSAIMLKAAAFWKSIDENNPPDPDYAKDAEYINSIYNYSEPGKVIDVCGNEELEKLIRDYKNFSEIAKAATADKEIIKARLLEKIGDAEKVIFDGGSISAGMVGATTIEAYERKSYRTFRVSFKKEWK